MNGWAASIALTVTNESPSTERKHFPRVRVSQFSSPSPHLRKAFVPSVDVIRWSPLVRDPTKAVHHHVEDRGTHLVAWPAQSWGQAAFGPSSPRGHTPLQRFFHASGFHPSGHGGQLDEFGIATGAEREELEWKSQGKRRFDLESPRGPFGTKEAPAIVESQYDVRIVGCSGGIGEDEHDVTWFHLEKGQTHECPVCTQVFELKVIGVGGQPGHDEHH